jgi:integrase
MPAALEFSSQLCAIKKDAKKLTTAIETKTIAGESPQDIKGKIGEFSFSLLKQGYSHATITRRVKLLNRLMRLGANLSDGESIKEIIAKQTWTVSRKLNAVDAYTSFLQMQGKTWTPPIYKRARKLPFIPTEIEIDQLIAGSSQRLSTYLQLLKETGMRCGEACELLKWTDIDFEQRSVRITPEKGSNPRILPLSFKLINMLNSLPKTTITVFRF